MTLLSLRTARFFVEILLCSYCLFPERRYRQTLSKAIRAYRDNEKYGPGVVSEVAFVIIGSIAILLVYGLLVFPNISREFGGGDRPLVLVVFSEISQIPWNSESIKTSSGGKIIGPVSLIYENQSEIVIASPELLNSSSLDLRTGQPVDVVVSKRLISAILYLHRSRDVPRIEKLLLKAGERVGIFPTPST
jgi:hypothetical protein